MNRHPLPDINSQHKAKFSALPSAFSSYSSYGALGLRPSYEHEEVMVDINTTPLIDVMLVLLIMLIISIPIQWHAVNMNVPKPSKHPPPTPPSVINIDINPNGLVQWNGQNINSALLQSKLFIAAQEPDQPEIHIRPHQGVMYGEVVSIMATAQRVGLAKVGLVNVGERQKH